MIFRGLLVVLAAAAVAAAALVYAVDHGCCRPPSAPAGGGGYGLAVRGLERILWEAGRVYRGSAGGVLVGGSCPGLARGLVDGSRVVNLTTLLVGGREYRYLVLRVYEPGLGVSYAPRRLRVDGLEAAVAPRSASVTYTGAVPYTYLVRVDGRVYRATFYSIGVVEESYRATVYAYRLGPGVYAASVSVEEGGRVAEAWLILVSP